MYKCKYFKIKELVNPVMLSVPENILWLMFDDRVLRIADQIREKYGECTVNTAVLKDCGLRAFNAGGAVYSQHKYGRALDIHILAIEKEAQKIKDPEKRKKFKIEKYNEVRQDLMKSLDGVNFENNISWLHCLDSDTEILTTSGWRGCDDILPEDVVINMNLESGKLQKQPINKIIKRNFAGDIICCKNSRLDFCVSDEHRLVVKNGGDCSEHNKKWRIERAADVFNSNNKWLYVPTCGVLDTKGSYNIELLKLCIAAICDGYIHHKNHSGNIVFHVNKSRKKIELERLFEVLGIKYKKSEYDKSCVGRINTTYYISVGDSQQIIDIIGKNKKIPLWFVDLSVEDKLGLLCEWSCFDGHRYKTRLQLDNTDEENIDVLQAMAITSGVACSKSVSKGGAKPCFRLSIYNSGGCAGIRKLLMKKKYNGVLWCVNTDNGTIIIRRNGKCCIIGNCDVGNRENRLFNP